MPIRSLAVLLFLVGFVPHSARAADDPVAGLRTWLAQPRDKRPEMANQAFAKSPLTRQQAESAQKLLWDDYVAFIESTRKQEWKDRAIPGGGKVMRFKQRTFGQKPKDGWFLFISMHGGGNAPPQLNDQQWDNQIRLYEPKDSIYIAPRAPTNTWNLWHEPHIDAQFDRMIEDAIVLEGVNPNRVYIMGYSAGGDGVYQLAPRMADRLAAAAMMAGHPNDASPMGLRNLPFAIHVGALDNGYNRNKVAGEWGKTLDDLRASDPEGYVHEVQLHKGRGHWMNREDAVAVDWMQKFTRDPLPKKVVWKQAGTTHSRFYWLAVAEKEAKGGQLIVASRKGQEITIEKTEGIDAVTILLNDQMVDLDQPIRIASGGKVLFSGKVSRTIASLGQTLEERGDPNGVFPASVTVGVKP